MVATGRKGCVLWGPFQKRKRPVVMYGKVQTTLSWVPWPLTHQSIQMLLSTQSLIPVLFHALKGIDEILQKHNEVAATSVKCVSAWKILISVILTEKDKTKQKSNPSN